MKKSFFALTAVSALILSGCATVMPIQAGGTIEKNSGKKVSVIESHFNFFNFSPLPLNAAEKVLPALQAKCDGGNVTGVTVVHRVRGGFFGPTESIEASGYCAQ